MSSPPSSPPSPSYRLRSTPVKYKPEPEDSPSRQLLLDLERDLIKINLNARESLDLFAWQQKETRERLDKKEQEAVERDHARIRRGYELSTQLRENAEKLLQEYREKEEAARRAKEEIERKEKERLEKIRLEKERKDREAKEALERKAKADREAQEKKEREAEEARKQQAEAAKKKTEDEAKRRQEQEKKDEEVKKKAQEAAVAAAAKPEPTPAKAAAAAPAPAPVTFRAPSEAEQARQARYLEIHQRLKELRKNMTQEVKTNAALKACMGDMRRSIKKCIGQLTEKKGTNKQPLDEINKAIIAAMSFNGPQVNMKDYIAFPPPKIAQDPNTQGPALVVYLLNILTKAAISQFANEAGIKPTSAEPVGIVLANIFSNTAYHYMGVPLVDILICKYRKVCPVLFGFYGNENTVQGRLRNGWPRADPSNPQSGLIPAQMHLERQTGLAAGFAAFGLRDFSKTQRANPFPVQNFFFSLTTLISTPPKEIQSTQLVVIKGLLENHVSRLLQFYGEVARVMLVMALVVLPESMPAKDVASRGLELLAARIEEEHHITLRPE